MTGALIFMCGTWFGVIVGFFLAGACAASKRADQISAPDEHDFPTGV